MNILRLSIYHIRTHLFRYIHFLLAFIFIGVTSFFILPSTLASASNYRYYSSITEVNEIWFSKQGTNLDSYYNFNGTYFFSIGSKYISADILMQQEDTDYIHNIFNVDYMLEEGTCLVSRNLMVDNNLHIGDTLSTKQYRFKIVNYLSSISGIDEKYEHEGIIILSFNEKMALNRNFNHIYFCYNGETGEDVYQVISIPTLSKSFAKKTTLKLLQECGAILLISLVLELVLGHRIKKDYLVKKEYGIKPSRLFALISLDGAFKYLIPVLLTLLVILKSSLMFPRGFLLIIAVLLPFTLILAVCSTLIYFLGGKKNV